MMPEGIRFIIVHRRAVDVQLGSFGVVGEIEVMLLGTAPSLPSY